MGKPKRTFKGRKRRVLLKGDYPMRPGGAIWFELWLEVGYADVPEGYRGVLEEELEQALDQAQTSFAWVRSVGPLVPEERGGYRAQERDDSYREISREAEAREFLDQAQAVWEDTEPPAPPEEGETR